MNKAPVFFLLVIACISIFCFAQNRQENPQIDFSGKKNQILQYLQAAVPDNLIITGQHCGNGNATEQGYADYWTGVKMAIPSNQHAKELMNDPWIITRDEMKIITQ